ncbi:MAG TPA: hypothetical protein VH583_18765 [Vicinamibacterales bacterium]
MTTSFRVGQRYKRVIDCFGAPDTLKQIEIAIDRESGTSKWVKGDH